jgi:hypothetical protein
MGRSAAFDATVFFTSLFGVASSLATAFPMLGTGIWIFALETPLGYACFSDCFRLPTG